ncbi:2785_t:CDS:2, partial [Racocetra fulgida]
HQSESEDDDVNNNSGTFLKHISLLTNDSKEKRLEKVTGLKLEAIGVDIGHEVRCDVFGWDDRPEREQCDRYLPHLRKILQISKYRNLEVFDASKKKKFLSMNNEILPIRLIGTTDAAVVDRFSVSSRIPQNHTWILFELKKSVNDSCMYQALAELTASDLKSVHAVLTVLTDLRDDWQFFCFEDKKIVTFTLPKGKAVALIRDNLKFANQDQNN